MTGWGTAQATGSWSLWLAAWSPRCERETPSHALGGDEFVVFAETVDGPGEAAALAQRVLAALAAPFAIGMNELPCLASVGVRFAFTREIVAEELLREADLAMYSAKAAGKA